MSTELRLRDARRGDLERLVQLLADDPLGARRERFESPLPEAYGEAFDAIGRDPHNRLLVAEAEGEVVGALQLTLIPGLTYQGGWRAQIEGVRVDRAHRAQGIGRRLIEHAVECARGNGCRLVQLTTDKSRPEALAFYQALGFEASHEGMKRRLDLNER